MIDSILDCSVHTDIYTATLAPHHPLSQRLLTADKHNSWEISMKTSLCLVLYLHIYINRIASSLV
jgi:hypothetical protein